MAAFDCQRHGAVGVAFVCEHLNEELLNAHQKIKANKVTVHIDPDDFRIYLNSDNVPLAFTYYLCSKCVVPYGEKDKELSEKEMGAFEKNKCSWCSSCFRELIEDEL